MRFDVFVEFHAGLEQQGPGSDASTTRAFELLGSFVLPEADWIEHYYQPQERRCRELTKKYVGDSEALATLQSYRSELKLYRKYPDHYGYVFYVLGRQA